MWRPVRGQRRTDSPHFWWFEASLRKTYAERCLNAAAQGLLEADMGFSEAHRQPTEAKLFLLFPLNLTAATAMVDLVCDSRNSMMRAALITPKSLPFTVRKVESWSTLGFQLEPAPPAKLNACHG